MSKTFWGILQLSHRVRTNLPLWDFSLKSDPCSASSPSYPAAPRRTGYFMRCLHLNLCLRTGSWVASLSSAFFIWALSPTESPSVFPWDLSSSFLPFCPNPKPDALSHLHWKVAFWISTSWYIHLPAQGGWQSMSPSWTLFVSFFCSEFFRVISGSLR